MSGGEPVLGGYVASLLLYLIGAGVVGLVGAVWKLYHDVTALKLHVAETYVSNSALDDIKGELKSCGRSIAWRSSLRSRCSPSRIADEPRHRGTGAGAAGQPRALIRPSAGSRGT